MSDNQSNISWHSKSAKDVMQELESSEEGLSDSEAKERLRFLYKGIIINHNKNRANLH